MKYFIDTEFIEDFHKPLFGKRRHFIDLISIAIYCEDGRSLYCISKEFDLKMVWNKWQEKECCAIPLVCSARIQGECAGYKKEYWLRDNVLKPLHNELGVMESSYTGEQRAILLSDFSIANMKKLIHWHGMSNKWIANAIYNFIWPSEFGTLFKENNPPEFYGYFADYDWVLFCSLFGKMITLPKGFPMYCRDLKQMFDNYVEDRMYDETWWRMNGYSSAPVDIKDAGKMMKNHADYPKKVNEHSALADAKWNYELYRFMHKRVIIRGH